MTQSFLIYANCRCYVQIGGHQRSKVPNKAWEVKRVIKVFLQSCSSVQSYEDLVPRGSCFFNKVRALGTFLADGKIKSICLRSHSFFDVVNYDLLGYIPTLSQSIWVVLSLVKMPPVALLLVLLSCQQCS